MCGMFDSFYVKGLKCPKGHPLDYDMDCKSFGVEIQTKTLQKNLMKFRLGQPVRIHLRDCNYVLGDGWIRGWSSCSDCEKLYYYKIIIRKGIFAKIQHDRKENAEAEKSRRKWMREEKKRQNA